MNDLENYKNLFDLTHVKYELIYKDDTVCINISPKQEEPTTSNKVCGESWADVYITFKNGNLISFMIEGG